MEDSLPADDFGLVRTDLFFNLGLKIARFKVSSSEKTDMRRFWGNFGAQPDSCAKIWDDLKRSW